MSDFGGWRPEDFILHRTFCPIEEIASDLESYRLEASASELLLIGFDRTSVLRTLTMLSCADPEHHPLATAMREDRGGEPRARRSNPFWRPTDDETVGEVLATAYQSIDKFPGFAATTYQALLDLHRGSPWRVLAGPFKPDSSVTVNVLLLIRDGEPLSGASDFLDWTAAKINATLNAAVHRDFQITGRIQQAMRVDTSTADLNPFKTLLELACDVSRSQAAAVLELDLAQSEDPVLVSRVLFSKRDDVALIKPTLPATLSRRMAVATAAFVRSRPQMLLNNPGTEDVLYPTFQVAGQPAPQEIALAIPSGWGNATGLGFGVLVICRTAENAGPFGDYDLALLRNVALRIALLRSTLHMGQASRGVIETSRHISFAEPPENREQDIEAFGGEPSISVDRTSIAALPIDLATAAELAAPIVDFVARITGSHSATLRLLAPALEDEADSPYEARHLLHRTVPWPEWRRREEPRTISPRSADSVNAWVARTGKEAYLPDLRDTRAARRHFPGLRSVMLVDGRSSQTEFCVPVRVDGRVVGTLNLEAPRAFAYELILPVARAASAQVSLAIAGIRRRYLREVLSIGSDVQNSTHDLTKLHRALGQYESHPGDIMHRTRETLGEVINMLQPQSVPTREHDVDERPDPGDIQALSMYGLVAEAARAANVTVHYVAGADLTANWSARTRRRVYLAIFEVLRNLGVYRWLGPEGDPRLWLRRTALGGIEYAETVVSHRYRPGTEPDPRTLYRAPVVKPDGTHFGAYTAGAIIRSTGGDITALRHEETNELVLVISLPLQEAL